MAVNEWEAKYKALLCAIDNEQYIENAEKLVRIALNISATSALPFDRAFYAMYDAIHYQSLQEAFAHLGQQMTFIQYISIWRRRFRNLWKWITGIDEPD